MSTREILKAVRNENWQKFRESLKGLQTEEKLQRLLKYWSRTTHSLSENRMRKVRIWNYINALRRGGQLGPNYEIMR
jgi:hypothetical protein